MPLKGSAFLALWNDIEPRRQAEYDAWHTFEHVPERVGIPDFVAGRRYVAAERLEQRYFTLYELGSLEALTGPSYVEVVEHPTDWSLSMRPSFRNVVRQDRKSTRLNSSHANISYAVFCLKKKKT